MLLVGPHPPPLGGVSTHVQRLARLLAEQGVEVRVLNHFAGGEDAGGLVIGGLHRNPFLYLTRVPRFPARLVHYHHGRLSTLVATALTRRRRPGVAYIATIHEQSLRRYLRRRGRGALARWALGRFDELVAVSPEIADAVRPRGAGPPVAVIPAYLPFDPGRENERFDERARRFLSAPGKTLAVSAYRLAPGRAGGDPYGVDVAVESFAALATTRPELRLAIFLALEPRTRRARRYLDRLVAGLAAKGVGDRVAVFAGTQLTPAFAHDVVYLRPSRTEGDAVSVREALDAGVTVVASDVVKRPEGVVTVPAGDPDAWRLAVERALGAGGTAPRGHGAARAPAQEHAGALLALYATHLRPADESGAAPLPRNATQQSG